MPMDSIERITEDSNLKLRIRVRSGPRNRANSGLIRIRANSNLHPYSAEVSLRRFLRGYLSMWESFSLSMANLINRSTWSS